MPGAPDWHPGLTLENVLLQPESRGQVTLRNVDPLIDPNRLADPEDMRRMAPGLRFVRQGPDAPALRGLLETEIEPGVAARTNEDLANHARRRLTCMWHPIGRG